MSGLLEMFPTKEQQQKVVAVGRLTVGGKEALVQAWDGTYD